MYPNLYYAFRELFGVSLPALKAIHTVGFFIAIAFVPGGWLWAYEQKYREKTGSLFFITKKIPAHPAINYGRILLHLVLGFIAAYKLVGLLLQHGVEQTQAYMLSLKGNLLAGLLCGALWAWVTFYNERKNKRSGNQEQIIKVYPHEYVWRGVLVAAVAGVIGSKLFGLFENWGEFTRAPLQTLASPEGFNYLGGLIVATFAMWFYHYKFGLQRMRMADALTPSLMLSYGLGRLGCQVAGDGDWGINNPLPNPSRWLPDWLWSYDYPHNVIQKGVYMQGCTWTKYCNKLPVPVYPTPLYECIICILLCGVLIFAGRKFKFAGRLSGLYLMLTGIERFFVEKIRVNIHYKAWGITFTQAEALSVVLFICGVVLFCIAPKLLANKKDVQTITKRR